jgi:hypothetical protein
MLLLGDFVPHQNLGSWSAYNVSVATSRNTLVELFIPYRIPEYSHFDHLTHDWAYSVYGKSQEELPFGMPTP